MSAYSDLEVVPPVPQGLDKDWPGPAPKETFKLGEREAFQAARDRLDRVLQVTRIVPSYPQQYHTPATYEEGLLAEVAKHSERFTTFDRQHGKLLTKYAKSIVEDAMSEPRRQGRLAEIKTVDRSGRTVTEFVGAKTWLDQFRAPVTVSAIYLDGQPQRL